MKYLRTYENLKYKGITENEFVDIFKKNCQFFSMDKDPLYRGDEEKFTYGLHNPIQRLDRGITYVDFFMDKEKDPEKYPVVRKDSVIGVGGGNIKEMIRVCSIMGDSLGDGFSSVYRVIPFDNSKMVFCPIFDLKLLDFIGKISKMSDDNFVMVEYNQDFKVPVKELKQIIKRLPTKFIFKLLSATIKNKGFEFFMSSPCLLIDVKNEDFLKEL